MRINLILALNLVDSLISTVSSYFSFLRLLVYEGNMVDIEWKHLTLSTINL